MVTAAHAMMQGQKNFKYDFFLTLKKAPALEGDFLSGHLKHLVAAVCTAVKVSILDTF